jgi:quinol-cytochrome oxidoreductase complex cytochrome b subunit
MVAVVYIHMARVFLTGAYRGTRSINWVVGIVLFLSTLLLSFTGYLLPWDQLAFWAITVGTSIAKQAPVAGPTIQFILLGGHEIGQQTLLRFYVLHVFFLPVIALLLFGYHMWRVRKDGGLAAIERVRDQRTMVPKATPKTKSYSLFGLTPGTSVQVMSSTGLEESDQVFSSPNMSRRIALVFLIVFNITLIAALMFNAPLEGLANPSVTPNPAKAPWYFVWLQELVASTTVRLGGFAVSGALLGGILLPGILLAVLTLWPWLDRSPRTAEGRWLAPERNRQNITFVVATILIIVLIMVGVYLRGPYWRIYWPGQARPEMPRLY